MYNGILNHLFLFVVFFILGAVCALVFDAFRVSERFVRSPFFVVILKDVFFWFFVTVLIFSICLKFNNGEIRMFMFIGVFAGAFIYFNTLSKHILNLLYFLINILKKIICFIFSIILIPLKIVIKLFNKPIFAAFSFSKRSLLRLGERVKFKFKIFRKFRR